jgi:hypothetical protein
MPASLICQGVTKSGSPMPSEMTSSIEESRSKNFLMPDGGSVATFREIRLSKASIAVSLVFGMLGCYWQAPICFLGDAKGLAIFLVPFEKKVSDNTLHLLQRSQFLCHETGNLLHGPPSH